MRIFDCEYAMVTVRLNVESSLGDVSRFQRRGIWIHHISKGDAADS